MIKKILTVLVLSLVISSGFTSIASADSMNMDNGTTKTTDGINAELSFKNGKAQTGNRDIMITLRDSNNMPITGVAVSATAEMDKNMNMDMSDSKPLNIAFDNGDNQGQYMGTANFTDQGKWIVHATIDMQGQMKNVDFDVDVAGSGPNWWIIGGFAVVIIFIIIIAAMKKTKTAKA